MCAPEEQPLLKQARLILSTLTDPVTEKPYWSEHNLSSSLAISNSGEINVNVPVFYPVRLCVSSIEKQIKLALHRLQTPVCVNVQSQINAHTNQSNIPCLTGVKNLIAVASGKGGVGKSSTAVHLAIALSQHGASVGLLDADIYGPSIPQMLGVVSKKAHSPDGQHIEVLHAHGIVLMSIGCLIEGDTPMVWRGPMATSALTQLLRETLWGNLDYLIVDMPPGTGDIQLTLAQKVPIAGSVIVTTPQDVALLDARKSIRMFEKVSVPILGIIENMSLHTCSHCGHTEKIFGDGGGDKLSLEYRLPLLGQLPIDSAIRSGLDCGQPILVKHPESPTSRAYLDIALRVAAELSYCTSSHNKFPKIVIE